MSTQLANPEPRVYRDYSPEFKAEVLAALKANNGNQLRTANEYGIDESLLRAWIKQAERYRNLSDLKQIELAEKYEANVHRAADAMMEDDLAKVSYVQKATAIGILTDKMLLLRGQPTQITASANTTQDLVSAVAAIVTSERISEYEAAMRLAQQLEDVPELASQLREWAEGELRARGSVDQSVHMDQSL